LGVFKIRRPDQEKQQNKFEGKKQLLVTMLKETNENKKKLKKKDCSQTKKMIGLLQNIQRCRFQQDYNQKFLNPFHNIYGLDRFHKLI
jgi:hypothetical protein